VLTDGQIIYVANGSQGVSSCVIGAAGSLSGCVVAANVDGASGLATDGNQHLYIATYSSAYGCRRHNLD